MSEPRLNTPTERTLYRDCAKLEAERVEVEEALRVLYEEVEMAESVGICLPNRVPALRARDLLTDLASREVGGSF